MARTESAATVLFDDAVGGIKILKEDARAECALLISQHLELERIVRQLDKEPVGRIMRSLRTRYARRSGSFGAQH